MVSAIGFIALNVPKQKDLPPATAPLVWLHPEDTYFPSDIAAQLLHTKPQINFADVPGYPNPLTLENLDSLNANKGSDVYLTSVDDLTTAPAWLNGVKPDKSHTTVGAISATVIVNDRGNGQVDAFYMYFNAYNYGGRILGQNVNEHVGDWEHNMIRFINGKPQEVWFSQHGFGELFLYDKLEKQGNRPVVYSAKGSHAVYASSGNHDHTIPNVVLPSKGVLTDTTGQGTLWDPILSAYFYSFDAKTENFTAYNPAHPTAWLRYTGRWGDQQYPSNDPRQDQIIPGVDATARFTGGPAGPASKQLNRSQPCPEVDGYICQNQTESAGGFVDKVKDAFSGIKDIF
ncbi:MAG: hypothetical protein LQ346_002888 [Caloplaca aetnensis]|nr:MAG: hypothetical protein LQ346_002888 [Caloplaca aetnensis]